MANISMIELTMRQEELDINRQWKKKSEGDL
jgi:hypothetical protein